VDTVASFKSVMTAVRIEWCVSRKVTKTFLWRSDCGQEEESRQEEGSQEDREEEGPKEEGRQEEDQKGEKVTDGLTA
jgi:hypothetical protein